MASSPRTNGRRTVAVIGGGAVGVATASFLLRDGHDVVLIERGGIGEGASFGNAGCLNPSSVVPMSMPGTLAKVPGYLFDPLGPLSIRWRYLPTLAPWLARFVRAGTRARVEAQARALKPLLDDSYGAWLPLVRHAGAEGLILRQGHLVVYRTEQDFAGDALGYQLRRDNGIAFDVLREDELWQFEPSISHDYTIGVLFQQNGHTVNPNRLVRTLAEAFQRDGGRILAAEAKGFLREGAMLRGIETDAGAIPADAAVVAAGAHSRRLAASLGDDVPLDTERGYHVLIADPETAPRLPILDASAKFVSTPMETGLRLAGTVEFAGLDAPPNWQRADYLLTLGRRLFPGLAAHYPEGRVSRWMGFRPSMPDSLPVIGRASQCPDVAYAFGHGHVGLAAGARTGQAAADLIAGRAPAFDLTPFAPTRF
ncbi:NAD(P)/FAD-dependent oxidoreductase [Ancylobacter mangrovi]|uniref:NAD(P)/FAD-dependent oxidoreductase n=1 Tax=Ancylobacter mangrovi TaxID=2972472 RepID=UPI002163D427|nr:FAD-dependent oxidoreductase [Ancylobacter mangrovi]MCS0502837.1 FAD-dependent oxidoreductase [Ancylobacter mangrovi]